MQNLLQKKTPTRKLQALETTGDESEKKTEEKIEIKCAFKHCGKDALNSLETKRQLHCRQQQRQTRKEQTYYREEKRRAEKENIERR